MYRNLLLATLCHAFLGMAAYYNEGALNPLEPHVQAFLTRALQPNSTWYDQPVKGLSWLWAGTTASFPVGFLLGALCLQPLTERLGRRTTCVLLNNCVIIVACLLQFIARPVASVPLLLIGRAVAGVAKATSGFLPVYVAECAPVKQRATVAMLVWVGLAVWTCLGVAAGLPQTLGTDEQWHRSLLLPILPACLHLIVGWSFPDSPSHLYLTAHKEEESRKAVEFYQGPAADWQSVEETFRLEARMLDSHKDSASLSKVLTSQHLRFPFLICVLACVGKRAGGTDISMQYSAGLITLLGIPPNYSALFSLLLLQVPAVFFSLLGAALTKALNRRPYYLTLLAANIFASLSLFTAQLLPSDSGQVSANTVLGLAGLFVATTADYLGSGTIPKFLPAEICPQSIRALTAGASNAATAVTSVLIIFLYPPLEQIIGAYTVLPLVLGAIATFVTLYIYLPETRHREVVDTVQTWLSDEEDTALLVEVKRPKRSYGGV